MRMMNRVIVSYVLALQRLFHFTACVSFLYISLSFLFFVDFTTCLGIEVSLSILQTKQWRFLSGVSRDELLQPYLV